MVLISIVKSQWWKATPPGVGRPHGEGWRRWKGGKFNNVEGEKGESYEKNNGFDDDVVVPGGRVGDGCT